MTGGGEDPPDGAAQKAAAARKGKFVPRVPQRRAKDKEGSGGAAGTGGAAGARASSSTAAADADNVFANLKKQAANEATWERGRGRGRGQATRRQTNLVAFGAGASGAGGGRRPMAAGGGGMVARGTGAGRPAGSAAAGKGGKPGAAKKDVPAAAGAEAQEPGAVPLDTWQQQQQQQRFVREEEEEEEEPEPLLEEVFDTGRYYPTLLPYVRPGQRVPKLGDATGLRLKNLMDEQELPGCPAVELGLHDPDQEDYDSWMLFQLPHVLPIPKAQGKPGGPSAVTSPSEAPSGKVGKLLVFESGAVKMQIGEVLFDVQPGVPCGFHQQVVGMQLRKPGAPHDKKAVFLGDVTRRVVVTPDMDQLLTDSDVPSWQQGDISKLKAKAQGAPADGLRSPPYSPPYSPRANRMQAKQGGGLSAMAADLKLKDEQGEGGVKPEPHSVATGQQQQQRRPLPLPVELKPEGQPQRQPQRQSRRTAAATAAAAAAAAAPQPMEEDGGEEEEEVMAGLMEDDFVAELPGGGGGGYNSE